MAKYLKARMYKLKQVFLLMYVAYLESKWGKKKRRKSTQKWKIVHSFPLYTFPSTLSLLDTSTGCSKS